MKRRAFIKNTITLACMIPMRQLDILDADDSVNDHVARIKVGEIRCTLFRDNMFSYQAKDYFINANTDEVDRMLKKYKAVPDNISSPFIAVLLQSGNRTILIDSGIGFMEKPVDFKGKTLKFEGKLNYLLQRENIRKEDITDVVITHFHPDHIGGLFTGGQNNFPNARYHMHEAEWTYWHSEQSAHEPPLFRYFIDTNITTLKKENLNLFRGDFVEIVPGITAVKAEGHTPGQVALIIHSEKKNLLYTSDAFLHPLHIERLDWKTNYDSDHEKAKQSRVKLLELANKEQMLVNAFHFDSRG